jgi:hypothetical protein
MEKSTNKSEKFAGTLTCAILACLLTGGIAATLGFSLPITIVITAAFVFTVAYIDN